MKSAKMHRRLVGYPFTTASVGNDLDWTKEEQRGPSATLPQGSPVSVCLPGVPRPWLLVLAVGWDGWVICLCGLWLQAGWAGGGDASECEKEPLILPAAVAAWRIRIHFIHQRKKKSSKQRWSVVIRIAAANVFAFVLCVRQHAKCPIQIISIISWSNSIRWLPWLPVFY